MAGKKGGLRHDKPFAILCFAPPDSISKLLSTPATHLPLSAASRTGTHLPLSAASRTIFLPGFLLQLVFHFSEGNKVQEGGKLGRGLQQGEQRALGREQHLYSAHI